MNRLRRVLRLDAAVIAGALAAGIGLLAHVLPAQLPLIERADPYNCEAAVTAALDKGREDLAMRIAERAAHRIRYYVDVYGLLAMLQAERGDLAQARQTLDEAFAIRTTPVTYHWTVLPYYHAKARLLAATLPETPAIEAIAHAELARVDTVRFPRAAAKLHKRLYGWYAETGQWTRALTFGRPSAADLAAADPRRVVELLRCAEGLGMWDLVEAVAAAQRDRSDGDLVAATQYALGRVAAERADLEEAAARFAAAEEAGHPDAAYHLGCALDALGRPVEAHRAWRRTAADSPWRPIALALAFDRMGPDHARQREIGAELDRWFSDPLTLTPTPRPISFSDAGVHLDALLLTRFASGPFPVLARWEITEDAPSGTDAQYGRATARVRRDRRILAVQWVCNEVLDGEAMAASVVSAPERERVAGVHRLIAEENSAPYLRVERNGETDEPRILRVGLPVYLTARGFWVACGRHRVADGAVRFGWEFLDDDLRGAVTHDNTPPDPKSADWTWAGWQASPQNEWRAVRLLFGLEQGTGPADFDRLGVFRLDPPPISAP